MHTGHTEIRSAKMPAPADSSAPRGTERRLLEDRYRCPEDLIDIEVRGPLSDELGYFQLGDGITCYGQCASGTPARSLTTTLHDASQHVMIEKSSVRLPFDAAQVIDNLRLERYAATVTGAKMLVGNGVLRRMYYLIRPALGVSVRKHIQKHYFRGWERIPFPRWPVDRTVEDILELLLVYSMKSLNLLRIPFIWFWPEGAPSCTMMTHDVETAAGRDFCGTVMDVNDSFGIKGAFQIVPEERYAVSEALLNGIRERGHEVNIHDLNHDGLLTSSRETFLQRAERINEYGAKFGALGFRSAVMYRNLDWYDALDFSYDMSVPTMAHLDPQQGGCCTVFPYFIGKTLELPLTTTQDYSLFNILNDYSINLWKRQIDLILASNGLISFIVHPDYIIGQRARRVYTELLQYISALRAREKTWIALPKEVADWWRLRSRLKLVNVEGAWQIQGPGSDRAKLAYAVLDKGKLSYVLDEE